VPYQVKAGGVWRTPKSISVKAGGAWVFAKSVFVRVGGTWRSVWQLLRAATIGHRGGNNSYYQKNADNVEMYVHDSNLAGAYMSLVTNTPVDLTSATNVSIEWESTKQSNTLSDAGFIVGTNKAGSLNDYTVRYFSGPAFARQITTLSVSSLSGSYYIRAHATVNGGYNLWTRIKVYRILVDNVEIWSGSDSNGFIPV